MRAGGNAYAMGLFNGKGCARTCSAESRAGTSSACESSGEQPMGVLPVWARKEHATKHARATNTSFAAYMPGGEEGHAARCRMWSHMSLSSWGQDGHGKITGETLSSRPRGK